MLVTRPLKHARLRTLPTNVAELLECFAAMDVDLLRDLQNEFRSWTRMANVDHLMGLPCLLVVRTPIERSPGQIGAYASKAFLADCATKTLAEKLGALFVAEGAVGPIIGSHEMKASDLTSINLLPMDVYRAFDRATALEASGFGSSSRVDVAVTLVGAGAVGSQLSLTAARMGLGVWTIVDPDHLLPHNNARHGLSPIFLGAAKAEALATEIRTLLGDAAGRPVVAAVDDGAGSSEALAAASLVIDASASVPVSRWLATMSQHQGTTASVFLNPSGTDLVVLMEGVRRVPRLDHLEMSYYWKIANDPSLANHLADGRVGLYPSGGCRAPSLQISQANVGALASLAAKRLLVDDWPAGGGVEIRRLSNDGISVARSAAMLFREASVGGWTVALAENLIQEAIVSRRDAGRCETGGILVGTWDRVRNRVYVVGRYSSPPDSVSTRASYVRGAEGVYETLDTVERRTAGNLTYIGEWHTHPSGYASSPSSDDRVLLRWIGDLLVFSDVPPLMIIVGEEGVRVLVGSNGNSVLFPEARPPLLMVPYHLPGSSADLAPDVPDGSVF